MPQQQTGWTDDVVEDLDIENASLEPPPPLKRNVYSALIVKAEGAPAGKERKPSAKLELQVTHAYGGSEGDIKRKMYDSTLITKEAAFRVKRLAVAAGVTPPSTSSMDHVSEFCDELVGKRVWLLSKLEEWQGKVNHKVESYLLDDAAAKTAFEALAEEAPPKGAVPDLADDAPKGGRGARRGRAA